MNILWLAHTSRSKPRTSSTEVIVIDVNRSTADSLVRQNAGMNLEAYFGMNSLGSKVLNQNNSEAFEVVTLVGLRILRGQVTAAVGAVRQLAKRREECYTLICKACCSSDPWTLD